MLIPLNLPFIHYPLPSTCLPWYKLFSRIKSQSIVQKKHQAASAAPIASVFLDGVWHALCAGELEPFAGEFP